MVLGNSLMSFRALRVVGCQGAKPPKGAGRSVSRVLRAAYLRIPAEAAHDSGMMSPAIPDADGRIAPAASRPTCRGIPQPATDWFRFASTRSPVCLSSFTGRNLAQCEDLPEKPVSLRGPRSPTNASGGRLLMQNWTMTTTRCHLGELHVVRPQRLLPRRLLRRPA